MCLEVVHLYSSAFEVTAAGGTVSSVSVTENASVSADDELLVLEGTESSAEYEKLLLVRKARTETLQKLAQLARSPQIIAEQDGIVQDVNVAASGTTSSESSAQSSTTSGAGNASQMAYTGRIFRILPLHSSLLMTGQHRSLWRKQKIIPMTRRIPYRISRLLFP